jgi:hypothetical protein
MNKVPMAVAVALVLSAPLAFAASDNLPSPAAMNTVHCTNLETPSPINGNAKSYDSAKKQAAEEEAMSLCRWDWHKDGGIRPTNEAVKSGSGTPALLFVRR